LARHLAQDGEAALLGDGTRGELSKKAVALLVFLGLRGPFLICVLFVYELQNQFGFGEDARFELDKRWRCAIGRFE